MNFAQMLMQDVKPLPDTRDPDRPREKRKNTWSDISLASDVRHRNAVRVYKAAVTSEWSNARQISDRMGMGRNDIFKTLMLYTEKGILEKRPAGGGAFNRRKGWEWKIRDADV